MTGKNQELVDCRFYENKFPEPEEFVMARVKRITEVGAFVSLLEYNDIEGMILMSELSKRRIRSVNKLTRVGRLEVVVVLRVDKNKGYIDLSKKRVNPEDVERCEEKFSKMKKVYQTVRHIAQREGISVEELSKKLIWPLHKKYGHALDALKEAAINPDEVLGEFDLPVNIKEALIEDIKFRLSPQQLKLRVRIHVCCCGYDGIDAVRHAIIAGQETVTQEGIEIQVKFISPPQYVITAVSLDKNSGIQAIEKAMKTIKSVIEQYKGGDFKQQGEIEIVGGDDGRFEGESDEVNTSETDSSGSFDENDDEDNNDETMVHIDDIEIPFNDIRNDDDKKRI
ncbi:eukaryotic translation initiation factor 2 alpha subunit family protein [Cryptosporidium muris RN66]|uniref:Eukaryotic translation initiation factor 2 alpha subunit family protein n=1 Tax=Cryptosporidium muris (strain RN66) TaxID=441375 RepID=B6ACC9_CRYMR|nr:eukaryotic translation initiation factor 2 alpha subunit family protein [Cryptosporidium muris RN66]EEA06185.1 eukaryotic translation initiation factor 2 alpha subunit family protein [Cryptosporidium muris RN66]|eukprot:XP_002140534.1 eukaryotic translation initiation factor 2 alpha subunit family protein [Cryptosporidium muris RN66]